MLDLACKTKTHKMYKTQPVKQRHTKCVRPSLQNKDTQNVLDLACKTKTHKMY